MKTTCWYEERRNLVGVFDFRSFHRFLFWLRADGGLALFFHLFCWFLLPGAYHFFGSRSEGVANLVVFFVDLTLSQFVLLCWWVVVSLVVCMFVYFLVALHLYIWGNIVLNTCMAFVVIKIVSLVSCLFVFCYVNVDLIRSLRSISNVFRLCVIITVDIIHSTEREPEAVAYALVCVCMFCKALFDRMANQ